MKRGEFEIINNKKYATKFLTQVNERSDKSICHVLADPSIIENGPGQEAFRLMECLVDDIPSTVAWCLWVENQLNATTFLLASWTHHWSTGRGISVVYRWRRENTPGDRNQVR